MPHFRSTTRPTATFSWRTLLALSAALLAGGSAMAADRVVIAEAFVDDG